MANTRTTRRSDGEGTYYKEGNTFCWKLRLGPRGAQVTYGPIKRTTQAELKSAVREELKRIEDGGLRLRKNQEPTVAQAMNLWLDTKIKPNPEKEKSYAKYEYLVRLYIAPSPLGQMKVSKVSADTVQQMMAFMRAATRLDRKGNEVPRNLSGDTVLSAVTCLCTGLGISIKTLKKEGLDVPIAKARDRVLTMEQAGALMRELEQKDEMKTRPGEFTDRYRDKHLLAFIMNTGLRVSEAIGITLSVVDLEARAVDISVQLKRGKDKKGAPTWGFKVPKGKKSRTIHLNDEAMSIVNARLKERHQDILAADGMYEENYLLFATKSGKPLSARNVLRSIERACATAGIPHTSIHDERRTYITHLACAEPNIVLVSQIAGHSNVRTTQKHYVIAQQKILRDVSAKVSFGTS